MSLFKAYNFTRTLPLADNEDLKGTFLDIIAMTGDTVTKEQVVSMISVYATFSVNYLEAVATTLDDFPEASATMKFMNSYIAEACHLAGLHYYNREHGYSVIDKAVQFALDNNGLVKTDYIIECIQEIEDSYIEEELEDESTD